MCSSSYPPIFRQLNPPMNSLHRHLMSSSSESNESPIEIPAIDLQYIDVGRLREACREWGLFRLVNHGVPPALIGRVQELAKLLFSRPFGWKERKVGCWITYFFGTPTHTQNVKNLNWVEGFHLPLRQLHQHHEGEGDEDEDPLLETFRCVMEEYGVHTSRVARTLFDAMAKSLVLDPEGCEPYLSESDGLMRVYRYPRCLTAEEVLGMDGHTDSSLLSVLNQDDIGGLQVVKNERWVDVKPVPDTLVVNLGDMMQAMSDDKFKSAEHRVLVNEREERISICYFAFPKEDGVIQSSNYRPFTYKEFREKVQEDIKQTGFKVGLDRFKI